MLHAKDEESAGYRQALTLSQITILAGNPLPGPVLILRTAEYYDVMVWRTCEMKTMPDIIAYMSESRERFARLYSVRRIGVFGSAARGTAVEGSDLDVLVEMSDPTLDHYMDLKFEIEEALGMPVDLVIADTLKERLRPIIEKEVVYA